MATDDFFRAQLDSMIDMRHPLAVLATRVRHQTRSEPEFGDLDSIKSIA